MKTYDERKNRTTYSELGPWLKMSGQLHSREGSPVHIAQEAEWAPESVSTTCTLSDIDTETEWSTMFSVDYPFRN
jgi:hypothetical protein